MKTGLIPTQECTKRAPPIGIPECAAVRSTFFTLWSGYAGDQGLYLVDDVAYRTPLQITD